MSQTDKALVIIALILGVLDCINRLVRLVASRAGSPHVPRQHDARWGWCA